MKAFAFRNDGVGMRVFYALFALCVLVLLTGDAWSSGDVPGGAIIGGNSRSGDPTSGIGRVDLVPDCGCRDLVYTELFKSRGLGYVDSEEFSDAILAVASGKSVYSPKEIPDGWVPAAEEWRASVYARPKGENEPGIAAAFTNMPSKTFAGREACAPALLYLASLEYRIRARNQDTTPVFPHVVRSAVFEFNVRIAEKTRNAPAYAKRAVAVMAKISEAERLGASHCEPSELARAKTMLNRARRVAAEIRAGVQETEASFEGAEKLADALLTKRQFATARGFNCYQ